MDETDMKFALTSTRALSGLALVLLLQACAQNPVTDLSAAPIPSQRVDAPAASPGTAPSAPAASLAATASLPKLAETGPRRFEQAWDVVELMGQPMVAGDQRSPRVVLRPQGSLMVDGGCNYFSGRTERDAQGLFRVSRYGGSHGQCEKPPRSEILLNSALVLVDNYRWDRGLVLLSGERELIRLLPSANQDSQDIERGLAGLASAPAAASVQSAESNCRQVKTKVRKAGKLTTVSRTVCKPVNAPARQAVAKTRAGKSKPAAQARSSAKSPAKSKPAAKSQR
jgi:META domain